MMIQRRRKKIPRPRQKGTTCMGLKYYLILLLPVLTSTQCHLWCSLTYKLDIYYLTEPKKIDDSIWHAALSKCFYSANVAIFAQRLGYNYYSTFSFSWLNNYREGLLELCQPARIYAKNVIYCFKLPIKWKAEEIQSGTNAEVGKQFVVFRPHSTFRQLFSYIHRETELQK